MSATMPAATVEIGSAERLSAMFDAHHQRLYRLARRLSHGPEDARDLVQETFLRAARAQQSIPAGKEEAWLVRVLVNIRRDEWRRDARKRRIDPEGEHATRARSSDHEAALIAKTTVWRALEQLPPRRRAIVVMYELEGQAIPAIAKLLGVNAVTIRWHLSRGRRELAGAVTRLKTGDR